MKSSKLFMNSGRFLGFLGCIGIILWSFQKNLPSNVLVIMGLLSSVLMGIVLFAHGRYDQKSAGIHNNNNWTSSLTSRGSLAWITGILITGFYILLYWFPEILGKGKAGLANTGLVGLFDPLSMLFNGQPASEWFVYGTLYTLAVLGFGIKFYLKYRHNAYQKIRTLSVMFFQLGFAFLIPEILQKLNPSKPYFNKDFKNMWPLDYDFFYDWHLNNMLNSGSLGLFMLIFGLALIFMISPVLTYFFGKRWYCSWICGCGGLAETAGDPFRHLSSKSLNVWKFERWSIHLILVFVTVMTIAVIYTFLGKNPEHLALSQSSFVWGTALFFVLMMIILGFWKRKKLQKDARLALLSLGVIVVLTLLLNFSFSEKHAFFISSYDLRKWYGFGIGAVFSGVVGVGFYPLLGSRVWCRFGCPMAAILGAQQRLFSKFRITTNGGQCISCGNCSTYCEMGIDVRGYAQRGENIVRSSCVGCGICSAVCPRGVLNLENASLETRHVSSPYFQDRTND